MLPYFKIYIITWIILTLIALFLLIKNHKQIILFKKDYLSFLIVKWKIIIFLLAVTGFCYISTLGYDPTWDIPETIIMSLLTYYTAPFSVGTFYRFYRKIDRNYLNLYLSVIFMFFSRAWFYDAYAMLFLTGYTPGMGISNLFISPYFYIFGGLTWSLDYKKEIGVVFVFKEKEWIKFKGDKGNFIKIFLWSLPMILTIGIIFGYFIYINI